MNILVANGVNLDLLGKRQPDIYGSKTLADLENHIRSKWDELCKTHKVENAHLDFFQTNNEAEYLEKISGPWSGMILNPGAWTHTSLALGDRVAGLGIPFVEVHLSDLKQREPIRNLSFTKPYALKVVQGLGFESYGSGLEVLLRALCSKP